jgi:hypothetical protein
MNPNVQDHDVSLQRNSTLDDDDISVQSNSSLEKDDGDVTDGDFTPNSNMEKVWNVFGYSVPKQEVVFFCQVIPLYIVIIVCLVEIILGKGDTDLWYSLLAGSIGYLLPNPTINTNTSEPVYVVRHEPRYEERYDVTGYNESASRHILL